MPPSSCSSKLPRTTVASWLEAQKRYTFWLMKPASAAAQRQAASPLTTLDARHICTKQIGPRPPGNQTLLARLLARTSAPTMALQQGGAG